MNLACRDRTKRLTDVHSTSCGLTRNFGVSSHEVESVPLQQRGSLRNELDIVVSVAAHAAMAVCTASLSCDCRIYFFADVTTSHSIVNIFRYQGLIRQLLRRLDYTTPFPPQSRDFCSQPLPEISHEHATHNERSHSNRPAR